MFRSIAVTILACGIAATAYADSVPVQGGTTGTFSNATTGTTTLGTWNFGSGANASSLVFVGGPFGFGLTPLQFNLGELTLSNGGNGGLSPSTYTADLALDVHFTTPGGQDANFVDTISLVIDNGAPGKKVAITSVPGPQGFTTGGETYTVTFDGMFSAVSGGDDITGTGLNVANPGSGSDPATVGHAWLRATVTAASADSGPGGVSSVPEPGSVSLLLTAIGGFGFAVIRKRRA